MYLTDLTDLSYCHLIGCWALVEQPAGAGRPRLYCCETHRREAHDMRRKAEARLDYLRQLVRREEHLLAALGSDDTDLPATPKETR